MRTYFTFFLVLVLFLLYYVSTTSVGQYTYAFLSNFYGIHCQTQLILISLAVFERTIKRINFSSHLWFSGH